MSPQVLADFFGTLGTTLEHYLAAEVGDHLAAARQDAAAFVASSQADLRRWLEALAANRLSTDEFTSMVRGQLALCKLEALKQTGLAQIRLDELRAGILDLILDAAFKVVA
jgi:hypothetical protein